MLAINRVSNDQWLPFGLDFSHGTNVILCSQNKFIINGPFGFVIENRRWMKIYDLIIFDC